MPPAKLKPSEIAAEAKKTYIPYIRHTFTQWPIVSYLCHSDTLKDQPVQTPRQYTFAFLERDAVDLALEWASSENHPIPVIMPAHEKRPGGDWEAGVSKDLQIDVYGSDLRNLGVMQPEECLCRRSTLYASLTTPASNNSTPNNYPIPDRAGIFSENVALPIISVPTVKRPKLDSSGKKYSFKTERELMKASMKTALRIAIFYHYDKIVIGTFGLGPGFKNPPEEVANLWRELLVHDSEFNAQFSAVIFAFEACEEPSSSSSSSSSAASSPKSSRSTGSSGKPSFALELEVFRQTFKPANIHGAFKT
ncbi:Mitochondrial chaperone bcs1 protein [Rutstroemia sp. NJR-2017a WRK4]|nr:Mitochondrial chaperone bcs1 protein [Rutstroemia sp. NJR-2017a WRK4]